MGLKLRLTKWQIVSLIMLVIWLLIVNRNFNSTHIRIIYNVFNDNSTDTNDTNHENCFCYRPFENETIVKSIADKYFNDHFNHKKPHFDLCINKSNEIRLVKYEHITKTRLTELNKTIFNSKLNGSTFDITNTSDQEYFLVTLNFKGLNKKNYSDIKCSLSHFDKKYNVSEIGGELKVISEVEFLEVNGYNVVANKSGTYYVSCVSNTTKLYDEVFIILPFHMEKLIKERQGLNLTINNNFDERTERKRGRKISNPIYTKNKMNVLILGFDSVSFRHLNRTYPLTRRYLEELDHNYIYDHFNSVGGRTYSNLVPLLTGLIAEESAEYNSIDETFNYLKDDESFFDKLPFIWYDFEKEGYLTMMQEDLPHIATFNFNLRGFRWSPTSVYLRGFWVKYYSTRSGPYLCHNGIYTFDTFYDHIENVVERLNLNEENKKIPFFSFNFLVEYNHHDFASPPSLDERIISTIKNLKDKGYLDDTLLILHSDHGNKLNSFGINSEYGVNEKHRPFLSIRLPKRMWDTQFEENIKRNRNRLVGMFDVYQTLRHLIDLNKEYIYENEHNINDRTVHYLRGISLFEKIPVNRSCSDALIPLTVCPCGLEEIFSITTFNSTSNITHEELQTILVNEVVMKTEKYRDLCTVYKFDRFSFAKKKNYNNNTYYYIEYVLQPGDSVFRMILNFNKTKDKLEYKRYGRIMRMNVYGKQSHCANVSGIEPYCYCKDLLKM